MQEAWPTHSLPDNKDTVGTIQKAPDLLDLLNVDAYKIKSSFLIRTLV
jgi:hypothetical protein